MELIKFGHACFVATKNGQSIVVDPGSLSSDFTPPATVVAIVVTHLHGDHWDANQLKSMPGVPIFAPHDAVEAMKESDIAAEAVKPGDIRRVSEFSLQFTSGEHARIHPDTPMCQNVGVLIDNGEIYYPGDSFDDPGVPVKALALPIAAPWMKTSEGMDFLARVKPERAFPTHDAILSDAGKGFVDNWMKMAAEKAGVLYERL